MIDINNYIDFLTKNKLTEHQFLMLWLVHTKDAHNVARYKKAFGDFDIDQLEDLIDNGWIEDFGIVRDGKKTYNIADFLVGDKFTEVVVIDEFDAIEELWSAYPHWVRIGGNNKGVAKATDPDVLGQKYIKIIKKNRQLHNRIIDAINKMKKKDPLAPMKIENFVVSRHWEVLFEEQQNEFNYGDDLIRDV